MGRQDGLRPECADDLARHLGSAGAMREYQQRRRRSDGVEKAEQRAIRALVYPVEVFHHHYQRQARALFDDQRPHGFVDAVSSLRRRDRRDRCVSRRDSQ